MPNPTPSPTLRTLLVSGALAAAAATAAIGGAVSAHEDRPAADPGRLAPRCLDGDHTGRFHVIDDHTLLVYDQSQNAYKLDIGGPCRSMTDMARFGFEFHGGSQICRAHDATLLYFPTDHGGPNRCLINAVTPLTRAEAEQLDPG
jgi:hypothetical protein